MEWLKNIDFENQNGTWLPMINDFERNQFYDQIICRNVAGKRCLDIGFGTGLLSILALKHGAKSILAYESNPDRYLMAKDIIKWLKLQSKIVLVNEHYDHTLGVHNIDTVISETLCGNLWAEGMYRSMPRQPGIQFLPGRYFLEIYAVPISPSFAQGLIEPSDDQWRFAPGVDMPDQFVAAVNLIIAKKYHTVIKSKRPIRLSQGIVNFSSQHQTVWGKMPQQRAVTHGKCMASYIVDTDTVTINNQPIDFDSHTYQLHVTTKDWQDLTVLIVPRVGVIHDNVKLYLDTGHWGPTKDPAILHKPLEDLTVTHDLLTGTITYTTKEKK